MTAEPRELSSGSIDISTSYVPRICFDSEGKIDHLDYLTLLSPDHSSLPPRSHPGDEELLQAVTKSLNSQKKGSLAHQYRLDKETMDSEGMLRLMSIVLVDRLGENLARKATDAGFEDSDSEEDYEEGVWSFGALGPLSLNPHRHKLQTKDTRDGPWRIPTDTDDIERYLSFPHTGTAAFMLITHDLLDLRPGKPKTGTSRTERPEDSKFFKYRHITVKHQVVEELRDKGSEADQSGALDLHQLKVLIPKTGCTIKDAVRVMTGAINSEGSQFDLAKPACRTQPIVDDMPH